MGRFKRTKESEMQVVRLLGYGMPQSEAAEFVGCSDSTVNRIRIKYDLPTQPRRNAVNQPTHQNVFHSSGRKQHYNPTKIEKDYAFQLMALGYSDEYVGKKINVSRTTANRYRHDYVHEINKYRNNKAFIDKGVAKMKEIQLSLPLSEKGNQTHIPPVEEVKINPPTTTNGLPIIIPNGFNNIIINPDVEVDLHFEKDAVRLKRRIQ